MFIFYGFLISLIIIGVQYFLSTRKNAILGSVLPVLFITGMTYGWVTKTFFVRENHTSSFLLSLFGGLIILLSVWNNGRESIKKKEKKELEKMQLQDLK